MSKLTHSTDEGMRQIDERRAREDGEAPEARHTEGPWHAMACDDGFWIGNDNENAAFVPGFTDHPLNQANANVVAAAPDMLAALKEAQYFFSEDFPDGPDAANIATPRYEEAYRTILAAIAKAEGSARHEPASKDASLKLTNGQST